MAAKKKRKKSTDVYKKRQNILLIIIGVLLIVAILIAIYFIAFNDQKSISHSPNESIHSDALAVDGKEENIDNSSVCFTENSITITVGEKTTPKFKSGSAADILKWESSDKTVAIVSNNGEISGISEGVAGITATVKGEDKLLTLIVNVTSEKETLPAKNSGEDGFIGSSSLGYEIVRENGIIYVDGILIANKSYALPIDYAPGEDSEASSAFDSMRADASGEGLDIYISSGFRSYEDQDRIYNNYASYDGYEAADTYSARPGHSEHQTGLAFDLNTIDDAFAYTAEGEWVKNNAHKYGFIIRYPEGKEDITGYMYEPWHIRYLGVDIATDVYESGLTLEEYLGIDSVYSD